MGTCFCTGFVFKWDMKFTVCWDMYISDTKKLVGDMIFGFFLDLLNSSESPVN